MSSFDEKKGKIAAALGLATVVGASVNAEHNENLKNEMEANSALNNNETQFQRFHKNHNHYKKQFEKIKIADTDEKVPAGSNGELSPEELAFEPDSISIEDQYEELTNIPPIKDGNFEPTEIEQKITLNGAEAPSGVNIPDTATEVTAGNFEGYVPAGTNGELSPEELAVEPDSEKLKFALEGLEGDIAIEVENIDIDYDVPVGTEFDTDFDKQ